jgi:hypothetical protein
MGSEGAQALVAALPQCQSLEELNIISNNDIDFKGGTELIASCIVLVFRICGFWIWVSILY